MKILMLTHRLPYAPNRGDRIRAFHLLRTLAVSHEVHLLSLVHDRHEEDAAADMHGMAASITTARVSKFQKPFRAAVAMLTGAPLTHALLHAPGFQKHARKLHETHAFDLVFAFCSGAAPVAFRSPLDSVPVIIDLVDVDSAKWKEVSGRSTWPISRILAREARVLGEFEKLACERALHSLVVNEREAETLTELAPSARVRVVPNGIDLSKFRPPEELADSQNVVFTGVMNYGPNVDAAVRLANKIWPLVRQRLPHATLSIVGSSPTSDVARLENASKGVRVTGFVPEIEPYYQAAAVSAVPLPWARGVQNKALEAIASGLPCVMTPVVAAGLPESVLGACAIVESDDAFASAIVDLLQSSPAERRSMAERACLDCLSWESRLAEFSILVQSSVPDLTPRSS